MKLVAVSGPIGAGTAYIVKRVEEVFPAILYRAERNGDPVGAVEDARPCHFKVITGVTPEEMRKLDLSMRRDDVILRVLMCTPSSPRPHRLGQPVFDLIIHSGEDLADARTRLIMATGKFIGAHPTFFQI